MRSGFRRGRGRPGRHRVIAATAAALAISAGAGCGSDSRSASTSSARSTIDSRIANEVSEYLKQPATLPSWPALSEVPPRGKSIYYIHSGGGTGQVISNYMKQAAGVLGWKYHVLTFNPANVATANSAYLTAVNTGADAIVSSGLDHNAIKQGLDAAKAKHVPVVQIQSAEDPNATSFSHVANNVVNRALYARVVTLGTLADAQKHGVTAQIGVVTTSGIPTILGLSKEKVKATKELCPKCTARLIDVPVAQVSSGQAAQSAVSFIQQHPDTNYISIDGPFEAGLRAALDGAGLTKVKIVGLQPTAAQNQELKTGDSLFWENIAYGYYGWAAVDAIARAFTGGNPSIHNREHDIVWLVDKGNMTFDPHILPNFPVGYEGRFKKLWRVP